MSAANDGKRFFLKEVAGDGGLCTIGYSDFHNLIRFTIKRMPNNILKNVCQEDVSIG